MNKEYPQLFTPVAGETYRNHGGGEFRCLEVSLNMATFVNVKSGWTLNAHGVRKYSDGSIEWDYSTNGRFAAEN